MFNYYRSLRRQGKIQISMTYLALAGASFALAFFFTPPAKILALKLHILDHPSPPLKNHAKPVPLLGGVSLYFAFFVPLLVLRILFGRKVPGLGALLLGSTLMMILGLAGEVRKLPASSKLIFQAAIGLVMAFLGVHFLFLDHSLANMALTVLWITGMTNALNIIDIMDGLAAGIAGMASLAFFIVGLLDGDSNLMLPAAALLGGSGAFLLFNWSPAKIYLGDEGSYLLGFLLAWLALNGSQPRNNPLAVFFPLLILAVPLVDTTLVAALRIKKGSNPICGSNDHLAQRMVMMGLGKRTSVLILILLSGFFSALAVVSLRLSMGLTLAMDLCLGAVVLMALKRIGAVNMEGYAQVAWRTK